MSLAKYGFVEGRHQRCALPPGGDIATAKVAHYADAGQFGKQGGVANLDGEASGRFVADGLTVAADCAD
ncbi:hypothetical protein FQZ97_1200020 [compost metagenome]